VPDQVRFAVPDARGTNHLQSEPDSWDRETSGEITGEIMANTLHWQTSLCISKIANLDPAMTDIEVEVAHGSLYRERQILIEALEDWLWPRQRNL